MFDSYLSLFRTYYEKAVAFLKENRVAGIALVGLFLILIVRFAVIPVIQMNKDINSQVDIVGGHLEQVVKLAAEYKNLQKAAGTGNKVTSVNLFARLEDIIRTLKITRNVDFMRPSSKTLDDGRIEKEVYVRFKSMLQKSFIPFLYSAEVEGGVVSVKHLRIKKDKKGLFDIDIIFTQING
ncbi:hypothetical protein [Maridesulfovibrio bastinii]|uniref:hypothetical protein n=1 Tax=Maridesulfovibrio bastinii TaxID=47157 RepID=UPI000421325F|nr:hypothetical protein [Maridesulfovibrio bastinii]